MGKLWVIPYYWRFLLWYCCCWLLLYTALFSALEQTHCSHVWFWMSDYLLILCFWISTKVVYLQHCLVVTRLVPHETAAILVRSVYTIQPYAMSHHFMQTHIQRVHACLAITCPLHFWRNDWDLLHATVATWGWNGYWNKSQHGKLTLPGLEPEIFQSRVWCCNHLAIPSLYCMHSSSVWNAVFKQSWWATLICLSLTSLVCRFLRHLQYHVCVCVCVQVVCTCPSSRCMVLVQCLPWCSSSKAWWDSPYRRAWWDRPCSKAWWECNR